MEFSLGFEIFTEIDVNELIKACLKPAGTHCRGSFLVVCLQPGHPVSASTQPAVSSGQLSVRSRCSFSVGEPAWEARARWPVSGQPWSKALPVLGW